MKKEIKKKHPTHVYTIQKLIDNSFQQTKREREREKGTEIRM